MTNNKRDDRRDNGGRMSSPVFGTFEFWRNIVVFFCVFSFVGHWIECGYCYFMEAAFDVIAEDYPVWDDPLEPYPIYGVATVVCALLLVPFKDWALEHSRTLAGAVVKVYVVTVVACLVMELVMGLLLNQPDLATGEYPLWDNSQLPFNILGQAWLVNDIFLGLVASLYIWVIYPLCLRLVSLVPDRVMNVISAIVVVAFVLACVTKIP